MEAILYPLLAIVAVGLTVLMAWQEGRKRTCGIIGAIGICLVLSPLFAYFVILLFPLKHPRGCRWCNNKQNEADYCGICGKNDAGELRSMTHSA